MSGQKRKLERSAVIFSLFLLVFGAMLFGLFQKQVVDHESYAKAAEIQSTSQSVIPAERGKIFVKDSNSSLTSLAVSEWRYVLEAAPQLIKDKKLFAEGLSADYPALSADAIFERIDNDKPYVILAKGLLTDEADKIESSNFRGVYLRPEIIRSYPEGEAMAAQVLGFVGADGQGKYGVEAIYDDLLKGISGETSSKKNSFGQLVDVLGVKESLSGEDLVLSIDYNLQFQVETSLKKAIDTYQADSGSIVVMNPKTGAILALSGQPTFDPNNFSKLRGDEQSRFLSKAASDVYEPGSIMKPITMSMALDLGVVTPETTETFGGSVKVLDKTITNADNKVFGRQTMSQILENSDNIALVWLSNKINSEKEHEYLKKFGFGEKSGVDLVGEQKGTVADLKEWNDLLRSTAAFGQGVSVNLIQMATAYSVIANGGILVTPHLAEKTIRNGDEVRNIEFVTRGQVIKSEVASQVREMLANVVVFGHGKRAAVEGIRVGGKTGTAQVAHPEGGYYTDRTIGSFAGMFPVDDPKFVMIVRLDNPKTVRFAESSAAPTFGEIANWITNYYQLR